MGIVDNFREVSIEDIVSQQPAIAPSDHGTEELSANLNAAVESFDIAIIGASCALPGGITGLEKLWKLLDEGKDVISTLPSGRWTWPAEIDPKSHHRGIDAGGFLEDIASFDAPFFRISPRDAERMDPQQRILLQLSWACLEDAGYAPRSLAATETGVFIGASGSDYQLRLIEQGAGTIDGHFGVGTAMSILANRISYFFDWNGLSMLIDTDSSSSLVAIHEAVKSLREGTCRQALVGGINILCHPANSISFYKAGMLAIDGKCKTFDQAANGYVRSEGAVVLLLKPLAAAQRERNRIYAVIKGSATNHGGQAGGLTTPNPMRQAELVRRACRNAQVDPATITYVEADGTGTALGDPVEVKGLKEAFTDSSLTGQEKTQPYCGLGAIKTNLGHLEAAAGITGLLKALLCLHHRKIPASLNFRELNPHISLEGSPFYVVDKSRAWDLPSGITIRRAGVSSFGSGGANAHVIVEEYVGPDDISVETSPAVASPFIAVLSARDEQGLQRQAKELLHALASRNWTDRDLIAITHTLQLGREAMDQRLAIPIGSIEELQRKLQAFTESGETPEGVYRGEVKPNREMLSLLADDNKFQETLNKWLQAGKIVKLCALWVRGFPFDWSVLYGPHRPYPVSLPTYAFARERYWIAETGIATAESETGAHVSDHSGSPVLCPSTPSRPPATQQEKKLQNRALSTEETKELLSFEEVWQAQPIQRSSSLRLKTVVCFLSEKGLQEQMVTRLRERAPQLNVIFVSQDSSYRRHSAAHYGIARGEGDDYVKAFDSIRAEYGEIDGVLYLWPLQDQTIVRDAISVARLIQAITVSKLRAPRIILAAECNDGLDRCYLDAYIGFERSLKHVDPDIRIAWIFEDASSPVKPNRPAIWIPRLLDELLSDKVESAYYANGRRHVCRLLPTESKCRTSLLREGGTYWITGGCGGLGLRLAEYLAKKYGANLILSGRSERNAGRDAAIRKLEAQGARVEYVQADVCDVEGMRAGLERAEARFGVLHGVIHAAGVAGELSILKSSMPRFQSVLEPKIKGTLMLEEVLQDRRLDFLCYYSSASAILGDIGGCDYAIANRFELAYARYCSVSTQPGQRNRKTFAVCWPVWNGGMGFSDHASTDLYLRASGQRLLEVEEGMELFERLLGEEGSMCLVLAGQRSRVHRFLGIGEEAAAASCERDAEEKKSASSGRRGALKGFSIAECILWDLKEQASEQLKLGREKLDGDENLAEFGFDSIGLAEYAKRLKRYYGVSITPSVFFSYPTLNRLGEYLGREYAAEMEAFYREEAVEEMAAQVEEAAETMAEDRAVASPAVVERAVVEREEAIAIIGMSGRFPQARNVEELWQILAAGRDVVEEIPAERFDWRRYYGDARRDKSKSNCKWSGFIPGVREFDPLFFEISPLEAEGMDPRQRLLLQESWKALEDAGYGRGQLEKQRIGMFVGVEPGEYQYLAGNQGGLTGNHDAILASRLAYFLNLRGPTMAINTACSSGLVAVHQACQSLKAGECDTAIAGSVNLMLTPYGYVGMSQAGMLSPDGKCYAFDRRANGMVPGEAVVAVALKRLREAEAEGDPIYAVIRGSGINYDGKTNGITAPSGASQADLLQEVYRRAGVSAREIEYIVTHGTGTQLGDPIEINALNEVFGEATEEVGFCALTSTKTNFGHTLAASGIVSLVSLVQAMRHKQIPASLHCEKENDYIEWEKSAFYVNKSSRRWGSERGKKRLGGVSAFGVSGTNAHVVVESYDLEGRENEAEPLPSYLLALSAKSEAALAERVEELRRVLEAEESESGRLRAMSYTLLCGRQHFEHRCALVVRDREQAVEGCLRIGSREKLPNLFRGRVGREFRGAKAIEQYGEQLLRQGEALRKDRQAYQEALYALADLYCQGYELSWERLFGESKPRRLSLPTYPFARESYWIAEDARSTLMEVSVPGITTSYLHPLVQQNTSDFSVQCFTSTFTGREFFLADHVVQGASVLPGVAYLEMTRTAVELASGIHRAMPGTRYAIQLKNVAFIRPLVVDRPCTVYVALYPETDGKNAYTKIYSLNALEDQQEVIHFSGVAVLNPSPEAPQIDLRSLRAKCGEESISSDNLYNLFRRMGIEYGSAHRGVKQVTQGTDEDGHQFVLAEIELPESVAAGKHEFVLHPSLMDAALQATAALREDQEDPVLPFALDSLEIFSTTPDSAIVLVRQASEKPGKYQKQDIDVCDAGGAVCVRLRGFSARPLQGTMQELNTPVLLSDIRAEGESEQVQEGCEIVDVPEESPDEDSLQANVLTARTIHYLKKLLAKELKLDARLVETNAPLEKYGINSIMVMQLTNGLEKSFGSLSKTLFFEYQNLEALAVYFVEEHREQLIRLFGMAPESSKETESERKTEIKPQSAFANGTPRSRWQQPYRGAAEKREGLPGQQQEIAIIGLSGRYPKANNIAEFWGNLKAGRDCVTEIPSSRWDHGRYFDRDKKKPGKCYSKWGGFLDGVGEFDPLFFNISPREAESMDPQERLFLQCVYETMEDAGYTREALRSHRGLGLEGNVGVFVGVMYEEYQLFGAQAQALGQKLALCGSPSSIANRVSFFCNFHGPSMAVDTMCSSSLTAIHLACQSLQRGDCEIAIAGGVNVSIHPNKYLTLAQGQFISSQGRCESFGIGGDGYVPAEGVGAVMLKPLAKAVADRDQIYGVIKSSALNHGGKTNGYSVPNPAAQANVIARALKNSGVPPRAISYLEAHGTGTSLGDPIEITGLSKAFAESTSDKQFCAIGSVKSNIGHGESAAGIAGLTKILLQMKYGTLAPSLHSDTLNPHIDFANSPFTVQQELGEWKRPKLNLDGQEREYPRVAGVSSFGAGGSNAHLVVEEYIGPDQNHSAAPLRTPAVIVLSAKTEQQLKSQVSNLLAYIETQKFSDADLPDMAYTLQLGREAMEHRLALMANSLEEVTSKFLLFAQGEGDIEGLYQGDIKRNKEAVAFFAADDDLQQAIEAWMQKGKYAKLLEFWVKGGALDWNRLYRDEHPRRISLPTYPFAKEQYWAPVPDLLPDNADLRSAGTSVLHPLVQQNTSDLTEQRFSSRLTGEEFYLADHVVRGARILPAVAYLEMARAAAGMAIGSSGNDKERQTDILQPCRLKDVTFVRPVVVWDTPVSLHIGLNAEESGEISFEIYSLQESGERTGYCQGRVVFGESIEAEGRLDLPSLRASCLTTLSADSCYERFESSGLHYGASHRGLEEIHVGVDGAGNRVVLAKIALPAIVESSRELYGLHPSVMDAALQASIGIVGEGNAYAPFAVDALDVLDRCPAPGYAYVREIHAEQDGGTLKFDVQVLDEHGKICVQIKGLSLRTLDGEKAEPLFFLPEWTGQSEETGTIAETDYDQRWIVVCATADSAFDGQSISALRERLPQAKVQLLTVPAGLDIAQCSTDAVLQLFEIVRRLLREGVRRPLLMQVLLPGGEEEVLFSGLSGMLKTAQLENPRFMPQLISLEPGESAEGLVRKLEENGRSALSAEILYRRGERFVNRWVETKPEAEWIPWKDDGVYLISGGAGGLGLLFAREIVRHASNVKVILTGRSSLSSERQQNIRALEENGATIEYHQVDVTDSHAVERLLAGIRSRFGALNGIIHSAGVIRDALLLKKERAEFEETLAAKITGVVNLDQASKDIALDFFAMFSSLSAAIGNIGQADYASGNAFLDGYSRRRNQLLSKGERTGRTVSINWPLWREGGMQVDAATLERLRNDHGFSALTTRSGVRAFYQALALEVPQVLVTSGERKRLRELLQPVAAAKKELVAMDRRESAPVEQDALTARTLLYLKKLIAAPLKLGVDRIESDAPFEQYGIDSVLVMQLTGELEKSFGPLSKTLFFECQSLDALAAYFLKAHQERLIELLEMPDWKSAGNVENRQASLGSIEPVALRSGVRFISRRSGAPDVKPQTEIRQDIAIIGVSGRYPQAGNLEAFWENLKAGRDCITEIPGERWDHSRYFDSEKGKAGKSYSKWGGFLEGVDEFDPLFFNISPREAKSIDPQERLFLQCVYETLEDAGYTRERLSGYKARGLEGNVGVFVGVMYEEYQLFGAQAQALGRPFALPGSASSIANRISYFCNFHGPSLALDTMCSSSLTAIHLACQSLQHGGCELAIAGGVNVSIHPNKYLALSQGQFVSSQGRCESFGEGGDGYVPGEGVGAVLLKSLAQAIADNDRIYGVIKATAINHGGKTNGYSVPSPIAQASVIAQALKESGVPARAVSYLEAHGTGTKLGDPIEIAGLSKAFSEFTQDRQFCAIGSVKSNIGHAESAAGIAGLTKILLQMKYGFLAPSLHAESLNPHIEFANSPFRVQRELSEWKRPVVVLDGVTKEYPRIAGISSFGAGGSNAHLILEEYVAVEESRPAAARRLPPGLIVLSAKSEEQLLQQTRNLTVALEQGNFSDADLLNIAYTLQVGREAMDHRLALSASSVHEITRKLERFVAGEQGIEDLYRGEAKRNKEALSLLANEKEWEEIVDKWIERGKSAKLLEAWAKGLSFDWTRLYGDGRPRPVRLPTYPFARERYWIDIPELDQAVAGAEKLAAPMQDVSSGSRVTRTGESESDNIVRAETFLRKEWQPSFARTSDPAGLRKKIFILADTETQSLATGLAERFPGSYVLYAGGPELLRVVNAIPFENYEGWVDLIGCGRGKDATLQWIPYLQQWIERGSRRSPVALCVTRGLESYDNSGVNLAGASRAGLYRMLQSEYGYLRSRHADLEMETADHILLDQIGAEIVTNTDEPEVCYRSGIRYRASLREFLDAKIEVEERVVLPHDAVLWITGGTRGIGYACARHFIHSYGVRRLVLAGRESFPPREQWRQYQLLENSIGQKIRAIQLLEADGAEIRVSSAPLTNQEALRKELAEVHQVWGPVNGVIHAAGLMDLDNPAFIRKSLDQIATVMAPKVTGLDNLLQCFEEEPLQFVALFSSVSGIIPNLAVGQSDYAMANAYMDYMADSLRHKLPVISIQWPNWKESGLGETTSRAYRQTGFLSHTDNEGLKLLDRVLAMQRGGVALPAIVNADAWRPERLMSRSQESVPVRMRLKTSSDRKPPTGADVLRQRAHAWLLSTVSESLNIDIAKLEIDTGLQDYGADSVMLAQLLQHVSKLIGEKLDPSILYEYPTVQAFASWLLQRYARQLEEAFAVAEIQTSSQELAPTDFSEGGPQLIPIGVREKRPGASNSETDVAVIGMSCRFPGAGTLEEYWRLLAEGRSAIRPVPRQRWGHASNYYAGLLDDITHFDPAFFLIPENTAAAMDPQALLLLEEGLKTCYHAGYLLEEIKGSATGVYLGARGQHHPEDTLLYAAQDPIVAVGQNYLAANISRYFDFHGPSLVVDTACSSALVAMNLAIQALLNGEIETALVGGVNILQTDSALRILEHRGILSSSPYFHIFDGRASGSILGEGAGMVLLKRIDKAQKDQDRIYAVVKSVAINNDGRTAGPTAPNLQARKEVLQKALAQSGKDPEKIGYIDVNGSGSEVTDLLELKAIEAIYRPSTKVPCRLGSMKPNIGHPLCAQGIASFLKVALMLHHGRWVPFLSGQEPMRHYDFVSSPFQFTRVLEEWDSPSRSAAINCFADGGTNAHVILESHESSRERDILRRPIQPPTFKRVDVRAFRPIQSQRTSGNHKGEAPAPEYHDEAKDVPDIGAEARFWRRPSKTNGSNGHHTP